MVQLLDRRPSRKRELIAQAGKLVAQGGYKALTIESLAKAAGVTKGGVQYHFTSKNQLLTELLEFLLGTFDAALEGLEGTAWLEAYVSLTLGDATDGDGAVAAIVSALPPGDPRCEPFNRFSRKWRNNSNAAGFDPSLAQIIRLAADGQWLERSFGNTTEKETKAVRRRLLQLIKDNSK
jgi:AcrR family transcriptional regulator